MKRLFNDGWKFSKQAAGTGIEALSAMEFTRVNLPHDWLIGQVGDLYESSTGFYRKLFSLEKKTGKRYEIYFEGVYMDSTLYVNGKKAGEWKYGYSSFFFDITDYLENGENEILVKIDHISPNSRWYSGAGIYRDVYLNEIPQTHIVTDSIYVSARPVLNGKAAGPEDHVQKADLEGEWELKLSAEIACGAADCRWDKSYPEGVLSDASAHEALTLSIPALGIEETADSEEKKDGILLAGFALKVRGPELWSPESPALYEAELKLGEQKETLRFGFRHFTYDTGRGFFINGKHVKVNGVCEHHDLGAIGAAFNKSAMRRKYEILRGMGVNAVRTAHNMPAPGLLELADELGFLVMDEAFDMWESSKTPYDYARFFKEWNERDVRSWIRRDRDHPSVFLWSIGNEIYDTQKDEHGQDITRLLQKEAKENDPRGNAMITMGSNYMPWEKTQKCADILKYIGYNYAEKFYDEHHAAHPDWHIFGSETSSTVQSRGIYHFPYSRSVLADDNLQCSALGNSTTSWGALNPEYCVIQERDHDFSMGQFLWSGFDYIGEPTPYQTKNSYFGQLDTAGFPKDSYFVYRAAWTDYKTAPFVHVFPYWDFNPGQFIDVRVISNAPEVELFVNGVSQGRKKIDHAHGTVLSGDYLLAYEPGSITARAYDEEGKQVAEETRYSFGESASLKAEVYDSGRKLTAGCGDMAFIELSALDEKGHPVENANDKVHVSVEGAGWLAGLDNGDSSDTDEYKGCEKRLFSGKLLVCIAIGNECGDIRVRMESEGLKGAECVLYVEEKEAREGISLVPEALTAKAAGGRYIRKIELACDGSRSLNAEHNEVKLSAKIFPPEAAAAFDPKELVWKAVNDDGIESNIAKITEIEGLSAKVKALGDGTFRLRCMAACGKEEFLRIISELDFTVDGIGMATFDPYSFVAGALWTYGEGDLGVGNDHGVSTSREGRSVVGFENIDFGSYGSDELTISIFRLSDDPFEFELWEGVPEAEGSELLLNGFYQKKMIWNRYQPETYKLKRRMKGLTGLYLVAHDKVHIGGFSFRKYIKAYETLKAGECDAVYGDSFEIRDGRIDGIGNNVTVEFSDMDFCEAPATKLKIKGHSGIPLNTIHVIFDNGSEEIRDILEFRKEEGELQEFDVSSYSGRGTVRFVFLPGSSFDMESLQFS